MSRATVALTSVVICHTVGKADTAKGAETRTEPRRATLETSLRSKSTIMRFSARSFALHTRSCCSALSCAGERPRGRVPFMGLVRSFPSSSSPPRCHEKKSSGDAERRRKDGAPSARAAISRNAPKPPRCARKRERKKWMSLAWRQTGQSGGGVFAEVTPHPPSPQAASRRSV